MKYLDEIFAHVEREYPKEACGLIVERSGEEFWVPCENHSENPEEEFVFNSVQYVKELIMSDKILTIVHSHPDGTADPSLHDIKTCNFINIRYMIVSWPDKDISILNPGEKRA